MSEARGSRLARLVAALALALPGCHAAPPATAPPQVALPPLPVAAARAAASAEVAAPAIDEVAPDAGAPSPRARGDRTTVAGTIEVAIAMLEAEQYEALLRELVDPDDLAHLDRNETIETVAREFAGERARMLLEVLRSARGRDPTRSDDGTKASFPITDVADAPRENLTLHLVDGRWYISD